MWIAGHHQASVHRPEATLPGTNHPGWGRQGAGAPDAGALAGGISEALINTFLGIMASAIAIILYNFFNTRIDSMTFAMDEANFTVTQTFASKH